MDEFFTGIVFGIFLTLIFITIVDHSSESSCQRKHNVADCTWVLVPTESK